MDPVAQRVATRFKAANWDRSVLPFTPDDIQEMDDEERRMELEDALHRTGDLLQAVSVAFANELGSDKHVIEQAAKAVIQAARKVR